MEPIVTFDPDTRRNYHLEPNGDRTYQDVPTGFMLDDEGGLVLAPDATRAQVEGFGVAYPGQRPQMEAYNARLAEADAFAEAALAVPAAPVVKADVVAAPVPPPAVAPVPPVAPPVPEVRKISVGDGGEGAASPG